MRWIKSLLFHAGLFWSWSFPLFSLIFIFYIPLPLPCLWASQVAPVVKNPPIKPPTTYQLVLVKNPPTTYQLVHTEIRLIIVFAAKDGEALYNQQKQDRELTVAHIMNSLLPKSDLNWRKWFFFSGKTTRPFRYDLNQIPYDYTVEVRNRFKGLDLIDRVPEELWVEVHDIVQEMGIKTIPMEKKCKKPKWLSEEALQIAEKSREVQSKGEKERYTHLNAEFQRIARRDKKAFLSDQCKEI